MISLYVGGRRAGPDFRRIVKRKWERGNAGHENEKKERGEKKQELKKEWGGRRDEQNGVQIRPPPLAPPPLAAHTMVSSAVFFISLVESKECWVKCTPLASGMSKRTF